MANSGLAVLAASLESLGGSGGDKLIGAWNTYGKNKFLAERARRLGLFDQSASAPAAEAPTPVDPIQQIISGEAPQTAPPVAPIAMPTPQPVGLKMPEAPQIDSDLLSSIVGGSPDKVGGANSTMSWERQLAPEGRRMKEFQDTEFTANPRYAKDIERARLAASISESSPYGSDLMELDRLNLKGAMDANEKEQGRVSKNIVEQAKQDQLAWNQKATTIRQYARSEFDATAAKIKQDHDDYLTKFKIANANAQKALDRAQSGRNARTMAGTKVSSEELKATIAQYNQDKEAYNDLVKLLDDVAKKQKYGEDLDAGTLSKLDQMGLTKDITVQAPGVLNAVKGAMGSPSDSVVVKVVDTEKLAEQTARINARGDKISEKFQEIAGINLPAVSPNTGAASASKAPPVISSKAAYDKLPIGATYYGPQDDKSKPPRTKKAN